MPPRKRSSSSSRSSGGVSHHSSSSSRSSGSVSHHSSSSSSSSGSSYRGSSSSRSSGSGYRGSTSNSNRRRNGSDSSYSGSYTGYYGEKNRDFGVTKGKRFRNTTPRGGGYGSGRGDYWSQHRGEGRGIGIPLTDIPDTPIVFERIMRNQPTGYWKYSKVKLYPVYYHCINHDYIYYEVEWTDKKKHTTFRAGYYDEDGVYHPDLILTGLPNKKQKTCCAYCNTEVKSIWKEEEQICPNCGGIIKPLERDQVLSSRNVTENQGKSAGAGFNSLVGKVLAFVMLFVTVVIAGTMYLGLKGDKDTDSIYVEEIGRSCEWISYDEGYYDPVTDCYFLYNEEIDYPAWQYWYEGISSDYEESGWMEYQEEKENWYIEESAGHWMELPEQYDKDRLWYIKETPDEMKKEE